MLSRRPGPRPHSLVLAGLVGTNGWRWGAEIGVFMGATLFYLLDQFPGLHMIGVDKWENIDKKSYGKYDLPPIGVAVREEARRYGKRCAIMHRDSLEAAGLLPDGVLDFVFIDAFHSYEAASGDIRAWAPKVRPGGCVAGHDWHHKAVARALCELLPGWQEHDEHVWTWDKGNA